MSGTPPVQRDSEHLFFRLGDFEPMLREWTGSGRLQPAVTAKLGEWFSAGLARLGHLARRAVLRLRDPGRDRQVFLRLARCAHRLPRQPAQLLPAHRRGLRPLLEAGQRRRGLPLHRQGHRVLPHAVLARRAARRGVPPAHGGLRAWFPDRERPEDVEVPRHIHHRARVARPPAGRSTCVTTTRPASARASTTST